MMPRFPATRRQQLIENRRLACLLALAYLTVFGSVSRGEDWPRFRGPTGMGLTTEKNLPTLWNKEGENVRWKSPLPGVEAKGIQDHNQSSPIVVGNRVIVTNAFWPAGSNRKEVPQQVVSCYSTTDGKQLWSTSIPTGPWVLGDLRGGYGAPTPCSDGQRVYVLFGSSVFAALDLEGKILWRHEVPNHQQFDVAISVSPVVVGDSVLLMCDRNGGKSTLTAYDGATGTVKWEQKRPGVSWAHSTPTLVEIGGKQQLLVSASNALQALDPATGEVRWFCSRKGDVCSPVFAEGLVYCDSGRGDAGSAIDPSGEGDVTKTHVRWKGSSIPEALSSPVIVAGRIFRIHQPGVLKVWNLQTGKEEFGKRLDGVSTAASPFATPEGLVYIASAGKTFVIKAEPPFEIVGTNDSSEPSSASAAVANGQIFLKGSQHLFCIGTKK